VISSACVDSGARAAGVRAKAPGGRPSAFRLYSVKMRRRLVVHERVAVKARRAVAFLENPGIAREEREDGSATADPTPARMRARRYA